MGMTCGLVLLDEPGRLQMSGVVAELGRGAGR